MNELRYLKQQLLELIKLREEKVNSGNIASFEVYRQITGERTGLLLAVQEIEDLQKRLNEDGDVDG